jgi:spore germination protein
MPILAVRAAAALTAACMLSGLLLASPPRAVHASLIPFIEVNGRLLADELARIENNRLLIGLRSAAEALGATVDWDDEERRITMVRGPREAVLWIDSRVARVDGQTHLLDAPPRIVSNRTIVPYRFVGEGLGALVGWDEANRTAWLWSSVASHTVAQGDSLFNIARRFGMTVEQVRRLNELKSDILMPGQVILVAAGGGGATLPDDGGVLNDPRTILPFRTVSGYTVVTSWTDTRSLESVRANGASLTDIATVSHRLRADGTLTGSPQQRTLEAAREHNLRTWLVVQNLDESGRFSRQIADSFLRSQTARRRLATEALKVLEANQFVGLELDLEDLSPNSRPFFSLLVKELKEALAPRGYLLSAAIPAKTADQANNSWSGAFDYREIGKHADQVLLMTYDEHWFGGPAGPIASLPWIEKVLAYSSTVIPPDKTLLGIAGYAYDWREGGTGPAMIRTAREAERMAAQHGTGWDEATSSPFVRYRDSNGVRRILWYENERSMRLKYQLAKRYGLQGIGIWRLGIEDEAFWNSLKPE